MIKMDEPELLTLKQINGLLDNLVNYYQLTDNTKRRVRRAKFEIQMALEEL